MITLVRIYCWECSKKTWNETTRSHGRRRWTPSDFDFVFVLMHNVRVSLLTAVTQWWCDGPAILCTARQTWLWVIDVYLLSSQKTRVKAPSSRNHMLPRSITVALHSHTDHRQLLVSVSQTSSLSVRRTASHERINTSCGDAVYVCTRLAMWIQVCNLTKKSCVKVHTRKLRGLREPPLFGRMTEKNNSDFPSFSAHVSP